MNTPRVNIYMPAYEAQKEHIEQAIESVLAQSVSDWTLLIQDDCSQKEDVRAHVAKYLSDPRITYRRNEQNLGIGPNWNACLLPDPDPNPDPNSQLDHWSAPFIQYLFHDDALDSKYLERSLEVMEQNPTVGILSVDHRYEVEGEVRTAPAYDALRAYKKEHLKPGFHHGREFLLWWADKGLQPNVIGEPSFVMLQREVVEQVGPFHESMPQFLDCEYWIRCLLVTDWYYLDEEHGSFRVHPAAASAQNEAMGRGLYDRFDCFSKLIPELPKDRQREAKRAFEQAFQGMVDKFFGRLGSGKKVTTQGSGGLKSYCMKHPVFVGKALFRGAGRRVLRKRV